MKRKATAIWQGNGAEGKGSLSSTSGVLDKTPYSSTTRFKNEDGLAGTNPEELIAAAHSGCFAMALELCTYRSRIHSHRAESGSCRQH